MNVTPTLDLSAVLPCLNEQGCVEALRAELAGVVEIVMDSDQRNDPAGSPRLPRFRITEIAVSQRPRTTGKSKDGTDDFVAILEHRKRVVPAQRSLPERA